MAIFVLKHWDLTNKNEVLRAEIAANEHLSKLVNRKVNLSIRLGHKGVHDGYACFVQTQMLMKDGWFDFGRELVWDHDLWDEFQEWVKRPKDTSVAIGSPFDSYWPTIRPINEKPLILPKRDTINRMLLLA